MSDGAAPVDLDACAVGLNGLSYAVDAAYYNTLNALKGALKHSGDSRDGAAEGDDETIDVDLDALTAQGVCTIALAVFAYKGGNLTDTSGISVDLRTRGQSGQWTTIVSIALATLELDPNDYRGVPTGILLAALSSSDQGRNWQLTRLGHTMHGPRDFQAGIFDIAEACLGAGVVARPPAGALKDQLSAGHKTFDMRKGDSVSCDDALKARSPATKPPAESRSRSRPRTSSLRPVSRRVRRRSRSVSGGRRQRAPRAKRPLTWMPHASCSAT